MWWARHVDITRTMNDGRRKHSKMCFTCKPVVHINFSSRVPPTMALKLLQTDQIITLYQQHNLCIQKLSFIIFMVAYIHRRKQYMHITRFVYYCHTSANQKTRDVSNMSPSTLQAGQFLTLAQVVRRKSHVNWSPTPTVIISTKCI